MGLKLLGGKVNKCVYVIDRGDVFELLAIFEQVFSRRISAKLCTSLTGWRPEPSSSTPTIKQTSLRRLVDLNSLASAKI